MRGKTIWQWLALVSFIGGTLCNVFGWVTKAWPLIILNLVLYAAALLIVVLKPVKHTKNDIKEA